MRSKLLEPGARIDLVALPGPRAPCKLDDSAIENPSIRAFLIVNFTQHTILQSGLCFSNNEIVSSNQFLSVGQIETPFMINLLCLGADARLLWRSTCPPDRTWRSGRRTGHKMEFRAVRKYVYFHNSRDCDNRDYTTFCRYSVEKF